MREIRNTSNDEEIMWLIHGKNFKQIKIDVQIAAILYFSSHDERRLDFFALSFYHKREWAEKTLQAFCFLTQKVGYFLI